MICSFANAQNKSEMFSNAVDYANCKLTYAYLNQFTSLMPTDKAEKKSFDKIKSEFGSCEIGNSIAFSKLSELLNNNNFKYSNQKFSAVIDGVKKLYSESLSKEEAVGKIINGIYSNPNLQSTRKKYSDIDKLKEELSRSISIYFGDSFASGQQLNHNKITNDKINNTNSFESEISRLEKKIEDTAPSKFSPNWLSLIVSALIIIFLFILFGKYSELKDRVDRYRDTSMSNSNSNLNWNQEVNRSPNTRDLSDYKKAIESQMEGAIKAISSLQQDVARLENRMSQKQESAFVSSPQQVVIEKQQRSEIFYASIPEKDGSFNESAITSTFNPTASFYKFTVKDSHTASFEFISDERAVKDAISSPELILYPVCKIKSSSNQGVKKIKTTTPGTVVKRIDKWELGTKAEIQYE